MYRTIFASLSIALTLYTVTPSFSSTETKSSGFFSNVGTKVGEMFSFIGKIFLKPESDENNEKPQKNSAELIRKDATVSENLHLQFSGPRNATTTTSVDLNEVEDKIAPLPIPEEPSIDNSKNLPIRKGMAKEADLANLKNESTRIEEIDTKISSEMPQAELSNTLSIEKDVDAPSMNVLEAEFASGNPPINSGEKHMGG